MLVEVVLCIVAFLFLNRLHRRWKYDLHKIPTPPGLPIPGNKHTISFLFGLEDQTKPRSRWWKDLGEPDIFRIAVFGNTVLFIFNQECAKEILNNPKKFPKFKVSFLKEITGEGVDYALIERPSIDPYVKAIRSTYATAFQSQNMKAQMPKLSSVVDKLLAVIESEREKGPVDFQELCVRATLDTIGVFLFDANLGGLDRSKDFYDLITNASHIGRARINASLQYYLSVLFPWSKSAMEAQRGIEQLQKEWKSFADEIQQREQPAKGQQPFWYNLRELINPETGAKLSKTELKAELVIGVIGGMDSTGHQLAWILSAIAAHPSVEQKIMAELKERDLLSRNVAYDDLFELKYITAVIKEGMRLVPSAGASMPRVATEDVTLLGSRIPKGTAIVISGNRRTNSVKDWGDPEVFRPERWLTGEDMSKKLYLAFSYGPRDCAGQRLAMLELKLFIVMILSKYKLEPTLQFKELIENTTSGNFIEAEGGNWLKATPRS